jgi:thiol-disulfide isomerase/thioredoxin
MKRLLKISSFAALVLSAIFATTFVQAQGTLPYRGVAPELTDNTWLNAAKPIRLKDFRGKVVLLHFWTFGCYNCRNTLPFIKDVDARLSPKGVQVIGIHFPEFSYEREVANVKDFMRQNHIDYPVAIDNDGAAWNAYEMHAWPAIELIDKNGNRRFRQIGEGGYERIEAAINMLLAEPGPRLIANPVALVEE